LFQVFLDGDSRHSNKRGPHLVDFGVGVRYFLGVAQSVDAVAIRQSFVGWLAGCWVWGRSKAVRGGALCSKVSVAISVVGMLGQVLEWDEQWSQVWALESDEQDQHWGRCGLWYWE
jgi:hypothetical protein